MGFSSVPPPQNVLQSPVGKRDCPLPPTRTQHGEERLWEETRPELLARGDAERVHVQHRGVTGTGSPQGFGERRCASSGRRDRTAEFTGCWKRTRRAKNESVSGTSPAILSARAAGDLQVWRCQLERLI